MSAPERTAPAEHLVRVSGRWSSAIAGTALVVCGFLTALALVKCGLRILERSPATALGPGNQWHVQPVPDERLGHRIPAHAGGTDRNGFRNEEVPAQPDLVALNDSITWGLQRLSG